MACEALLGVYALKKATPYGLGLVNDSAAYVAGAESIVEGRGYSRLSGGGEVRPIVHFPPLYSAMLAVVGVAGLDLLVTARILGLLLFAAGILLAGWLAYRVTRSPFLAVAASGLVAASDVLLGVYSFALSEPLFLALMLASFCFLAEFDARPGPVWVILAGIAVALASLTRFTGTALLASAVLGLAKPAAGMKNGLRHLVLLILPSVLLLGSWITRNIIVAGTPANRMVAWHPVSSHAVSLGLRNLAAWAQPDGLLGGWAGLPALVDTASWLFFASIILWLWLRNRGPSPNTASSVRSMAWFVPVYAAFLIISISLFDASTPLDSRLFSPITMTLIVLSVLALKGIWDLDSVPARVGAAVVLTFLVATSVQDARAQVNRLGVGGQGFASLGWQRSPAVQAIRELPPATLLYSDRPTAIDLLTSRTAYVVPTPTDPATNLPRPNYRSDLESMRARILRGEAVLVLFEVDPSEDADSAIWYHELIDGLPILAEFNDAVLYGKP